MQPSLQRIHPLVAAAAVSIILVSMLGVATMTGVLPHSNSRPTKATASDTAVVKPALLVASAAQGNVRPTVETPAANSATDASRRPPTAGETLAPGETLITLPAVASVASTKAPAASTPVVRESRRRASVGRRVVEPWGAAPPRQLPAQRIVPVYRDQRLPRTTVPSPQETGGAADIEQPVPMYSHGAASERAFLGTQAYRRAVRGEDEGEGRSAREPVRGNDPGWDGPATRFGTTLGHTLGDGIDRTISAIADVLSGGVAVARSPQRNAGYGSASGER